MTAAGPAELVFVPLGGAGEIGMNLNLYGYGPPDRQRWLMVDLGITFGAGSAPGVDVILPDPTFIAERCDALDGILLTHAREDHLGAVPYLWPRLGVPVYGTAFTLAVLARKLAEVGLDGAVPLVEVPQGGRIAIGPFDLELVGMTHSIPESNAVVIRTPAGTVVHTGDWKLDPEPVVGHVSDEEKLRRVGDEGVLALVCDSTNVFEAGKSGSEGDLLPALSEIIGGCVQRVAVTCFATNIARLETIARAAAANGRDVVLAGRSFRRITEAARETGYLGDIPAFIDEAECGYLPRDRVVVVCTGSQGEPRAALSRIAAGDHPNVDLESGDTVIFSSRVIPGNEIAVGRVQDDLIRRGVEIVTWRDAQVHVSGHPARDELAAMYRLVRPSVCVPVHGTLHHMDEQARFARACQVPAAVVAENGSVARLAPGTAEVAGQVPSGRLSLEGGRVVPMDGDLVRGRIRALYNGHAVATVVLGADGTLSAEPQVSSVGVVEAGEEGVEAEVRAAIRSAVDGLPRKSYGDDDTVREAVRIAVRRAFRDHIGKRPRTEVHLVRV